MRTLFSRDYNDLASFCALPVAVLTPTHFSPCLVRHATPNRGPFLPLMSGPQQRILKVVYLPPFLEEPFSQEHIGPPPGRLPHHLFGMSTTNLDSRTSLRIADLLPLSRTTQVFRRLTPPVLPFFF